MSASLADPGARCSDEPNMAPSLAWGKNTGWGHSDNAAVQITARSSTALRGETSADALGDAGRGILHGVPRQVSVAGRSLNLGHQGARDDEVRTWMVEVMGFDRPGYLAGKEVTHERMQGLGAVILTDGKRFEMGSADEGRKVTERIRAYLEGLWRGSTGEC